MHDLEAVFAAVSMHDLRQAESTAFIGCCCLDGISATAVKMPRGRCKTFLASGMMCNVVEVVQQRGILDSPETGPIGFIPFRKTHSCSRAGDTGQSVLCMMCDDAVRRWWKAGSEMTE